MINALLPLPDQKQEPAIKFVRRHYECDSCNKEYPVYINANEFTSNGLIRMTDYHECEGKTSYFNLFIDHNYEIRGTHRLELGNHTEPGTIQVPTVGTKKIHLTHLPGLGRLNMIIWNTKENYQIRIGKIDGTKITIPLISDNETVEAVIYDSPSKLEEIMISWISHMLNFIELYNPTLDEIVDGLVLKNPNYYNDHFEGWLTSLDYCEHCGIDSCKL